MGLPLPGLPCPGGGPSHRQERPVCCWDCRLIQGPRRSQFITEFATIPAESTSATTLPTDSAISLARIIWVFPRHQVDGRRGYGRLEYGAEVTGPVRIGDGP
jgi:hypothetical protein